jgi:hypothetical protein
MVSKVSGFENGALFGAGSKGQVRALADHPEPKIKSDENAIQFASLFT